MARRKPQRLRSAQERALRAARDGLLVRDGTRYWAGDWQLQRPTVEALGCRGLLRLPSVLLAGPAQVAITADGLAALALLEQPEVVV